MSQCVPNWDLDENPAAPRITQGTHSGSSNTVPTQTPSYEVAELTWENGQLSMQGLGRVSNKPIVPSTPTWEKPRAGGTLESIVNQATRYTSLKSTIDNVVGSSDTVNELVPWFDHHGAMVKPPVSTSNTITMDALVPCKNGGGGNEASTCMVGCSTRVGSCSGARNGGVRVAPAARVANVSESESGTCGDLGGSTSLGSPENTSSGNDYTKISTDDYDSLCHTRSQREAAFNAGGKKKLGIAKSSISTKRSRAAAVHNQSERKRRDKINQKMKTLQKLVPNSSKTDKASMLDEVIEYLKQLQAQVQMMRGMNMPSMMLPMAMQQQLQMSMMGMGMGMGMGVMDMNTMSRAAAGMPPVVPSPASFMQPQPSWDNPGQDRVPTPASFMPDPFSAFLACQSQPMSSFDAYSRMAAMYQQFQQNLGYGSKK